MVIICSLLLLTGCWDRQEPENLAIVLAGGYDYNPDTNMYKIILQVASPLVAAGGVREVAVGQKIHPTGPCLVGAIPRLMLLPIFVKKFPGRFTIVIYSS